MESFKRYSCKVLFPYQLQDEFKISINEKYCAEYLYTNLNYIDEMANELGINLLIVDKKELLRKDPMWKAGNDWNQLNLGGEFILFFLKKRL